MPSAGLSVLPVTGVGEIRPGDEIATHLATAADGAGTPLTDGDCLVVTQKIVSKAEGRLVPLDHSDRDARLRLVESESVRILRRRGELIISETSHGFVCANSGVDLSNVEDGMAALLPVEPDRSARHIRDALRARHGVDVAVIVSDTFGRPWRNGLTDVAIGVCGIAAIVDLRESTDALGRVLQVTEVALADEIASAAELVMGKAAGIPAAIVRGLDPAWFREGSAARAGTARIRGSVPVSDGVAPFVSARRSIRSFSQAPVDPRVVDALIESACLAPAPHHTRPWRFVVIRSDAARVALAGSMGVLWRRDLEADGVEADRIDALVGASRSRIVGAPVVLLACLTGEGLHRYPDTERMEAEWTLAVLSLGAAVENLLLAAADAGLGACWVAAPAFASNAAREALALADNWYPQAMVIVGHPDESRPPNERPPLNLDAMRVVM